MFKYVKQIIKKKSNSNNSFKILNWLYFNNGTKKQLKKLLQEEISSENKKSKLIAIQIYKNIIDEQTHILKKKEGKKKKKKKKKVISFNLKFQNFKIKILNLIISIYIIIMICSHISTTTCIILF